MKETFYGILSATALGIRSPNYEGLHNYRDSEWRGIADRPNVKAAIALAEIGETDLADQFIRYQARIGFDDSFIYRELDAPVSERAIPMIQMMRAEALSAFEEWERKSDKVPY